jgi:hypothetical protein
MQGSYNYNLNPEQLEAFRRLSQQEYVTPEGLENREQLERQVDEVSQLGQILGSGDRSGVLRKFAGKGQYTAGQQRLDNLLLGKTAGSMLRGARREANVLGQDFEQAVDTAQMQGLTEKEAQKKALAEVAGNVDEASTEFNQTLDSAVTRARDSGRTLREQLVADVQDGVISDENASKLLEAYNKDDAFISARELINESQFDEAAVNRSTVASKEQARLQKALASINQAMSKDFANDIDESQAGQASPQLGFNFKDYTDIVKQRKRDYEQKSADIENRKRGVFERGEYYTMYDPYTDTSGGSLNAFARSELNRISKELNKPIEQLTYNDLDRYGGGYHRMFAATEKARQFNQELENLKQENAVGGIKRSTETQDRTRKIADLEDKMRKFDMSRADQNTLENIWGYKKQDIQNQLDDLYAARQAALNKIKGT